MPDSAGLKEINQNEQGKNCINYLIIRLTWINIKLKPRYIKIR